MHGHSRRIKINNISFDINEIHRRRPSKDTDYWSQEVNANLDFLLQNRDQKKFQSNSQRTHAFYIAICHKLEKRKRHSAKKGPVWFDEKQILENVFNEKCSTLKNLWKPIENVQQNYYTNSQVKIWKLGGEPLRSWDAGLRNWEPELRTL